MNERVLVGDPHFPLARVEDLLTGTGVEVAASAPPWRDDAAVGLLVGPDYPVRERDFAALPKLRVVATCSVGYDHIDVSAAARRGIWVCNMPDYCIDEMADSALALLLALLRGVVALDRSVRAGDWDYRAAGPLRRFAATRVGLVGFGKTGKALARRAAALGFEVWASDPAVSDEAMSAAAVRRAPLDELLAACDAVSLHVPLVPETNGLIGERELRRMPRGAVLVNTARAALVDMDALLRALADGHLAGAALDVLPVEPPTSLERAPEAPTLIVTPHSAWYSEEAEDAVYRGPVLAVRAVLEGDEPDGAVVRP